MNTQEIRKLIESTMKQFKLNIPIQIEWKRRFTRKMADARLFPGGFGRIRLSVPLWPRQGEAEQRNTIIHEVCHIIARSQNRFIKPHGSEWKRLMRQCGEKSERCHAVDARDLRRVYTRRAKVEVYCKCSSHLIGPVRADRMRAGTHSYRCGICHNLLSFSPI
jgi:SprT protein